MYNQLVKKTTTEKKQTHRYSELVGYQQGKGEGKHRGEGRGDGRHKLSGVR